MKLHFVSAALASTVLLIGVATYASPILLAVTWFRRIRSNDRYGMRGQWGWVSLVMASTGFVLFTVSIAVSPDPGSLAFDGWFLKWLKICFIVSAAGFVASLVGTGKMQWAVTLS